jgi:two-component system, NtrC family, sensor kinase
MAVTDSDTSATSARESLTEASLPGSNVLSRRLATGFGLVGLVALAMCVILEILLGAVETSVVTMQSEEMAIRDGLALATAVREQYIHIAHVLVERTDAHMDHYPGWVARVEQGAASFRARLPTTEHWRIDRVIADSKKLDEVFQAQLLPAVGRPDFERALATYHHEMESVSADAVAQADALARAAEGGMAAEHDRAIRSSRLGLLAGALCMVAIVALSVGYTRRLRHSFLAPLAALTAAAERFGRGDFEQRVSTVGEGELQAVADAFDHMVRELQRRERKLLDAERMAVVGQFAAGVAHEINNPIGVIRGYLKTMKPTQPPEMLRDELNILDEEAAACQRIAEDLLAFALPGQVELELVAIDELTRSVAQRFVNSGQAKGHAVSANAAPAPISADAGRLRQVLLNLLRNAMQASPPHAPIEVGGSLSPDGRSYVLTVADRGSGIPDTDKTRIFEPFFSKRDGGSGLGLAVCHGIVVAHGGRIEVEDRLGGGTTVRLTLPLAAQETKS